MLDVPTLDDLGGVVGDEKHSVDVTSRADKIMALTFSQVLATANILYVTSQQPFFILNTLLQYIHHTLLSPASSIVVSPFLPALWVQTITNCLASAKMLPRMKSKKRTRRW